MSEFKDMKIWLKDEQTSHDVRVELYKQGYNFRDLGPFADAYEHDLALYTYDSGLVMNGVGRSYFDNHPNKEHFFTFGGEFVEKESFQQPIAPSFKDSLDAAKPLSCHVARGEQLITSQKAVADKILDKLFSIDPFAICAGGAPRDWHFGKPATDLDIFFHTSVDQLTIVAEMLRHVGIDTDLVQSADNLPEWYKLNPSLLCVYPTIVDGVNVQIMLMKDKTHCSVIPHFPFSICKAWYKNGHVSLDRDFTVAERQKVVVRTNTVYNDEHKYVQKIKAKFSDWHFCESWEEAYKYAFYKEN